METHTDSIQPARRSAAAKTHCWVVALWSHPTRFSVFINVVVVVVVVVVVDVVDVIVVGGGVGFRWWWWC